MDRRAKNMADRGQGVDEGPERQGGGGVPTAQISPLSVITLLLLFCGRLITLSFVYGPRIFIDQYRLPTCTVRLSQ